MSQHGQYEIEGRVGGPFSVVQLQLMAASGMLQPHDRIRRKKSEEWYNAGSVRELFGAAPLVPTAVPRAAQTEPTPANGSQQSVPHESANEEIRAAFDFFSTPTQPQPAPAAKVREESPPVKPSTFELPRAPEQVPAAPNSVDENPFDFRLEPVGSARQDSKSEPEATVLMDAPDLAVKAAVTEQAPAARVRNTPTAGKKTELVIELKTPAKQEQVSTAKTDDAGKTKTDMAAAVGAAKTAAASSTRPEVSGHAVELLSDGSARPLDGKCVFRLHRAWLLFATKYGDESARAVYLRLQQIDAGIIEHRPASAHVKGGPYSVLTFSAGKVEVSLAFQGTDKPYRLFLEKVLTQCSAIGNHKP